MTAEQLRICPSCGCYLSRYNPGDRCAACHEKYQERLLPALDLDFLVLAILAEAHATSPDEPVDVLAALRDRGVEADCWTVGLAVRHIGRRFGIIASGTKGRPGYRVTAVEYRYKPAIGCAGVVMQRGEDGRFSGVASALHGCERPAEVAPDQPALFALSGPDTGG